MFVPAPIPDGDVDDSRGMRPSGRFPGDGPNQTEGTPTRVPDSLAPRSAHLRQANAEGGAGGDGLFLCQGDEEAGFAAGVFGLRRCRLDGLGPEPNLE